MSEMLTYAPDLRALTGGQGDYTMEFLRYEEIPGSPRPEGGRRGARGGRGRQGLNARLSSGNRARAHAAEGGPTATLGRLVTRKSISTNTPVVNCDVCGRTLLPGEAPTSSCAAGEKRNVCELCTQRAVARGLDPRGPRRRDRPRRGQQRPLARAAVAPARPPRPRRRPRRATTITLPAQQDRERERPPQPVREQRNVHAIPTNADLKMARALDLFNGSSHPRTVAGVARSLGPPIVAVRPSLTEGSVVTIVVGWELSGTASRSTSATRPPGCGSSTRGPSCPSSSPPTRCPTPRPTSRASCTSPRSTRRFPRR